MFINSSVAKPIVKLIPVPPWKNDPADILVYIPDTTDCAALLDEKALLLFAATSEGPTCMAFLQELLNKLTMASMLIYNAMEYIFLIFMVSFFLK